MSKKIIVSNRLPIKTKIEDDDISFISSPGGLATAMKSFFQSRKALWVGWPGLTSNKLGDKRKRLTKKLEDKNYSPVYLSERDFEEFYYGFSNKVVWPLFHYFLQLPDYNEELWKAYKRVNHKFCEAVLEKVEPGDLVWIHDYHLMLLPEMLRKKMPSLDIGFFLHIPFPSYEVFRQIPWSREILKSLISSDVVGFHTYDYVQHFLESVFRLLGHESNLGEIIVKDHLTKVDSFPMGIDFSKFNQANKRKRVKNEIKKFKKEVGKQKVILSVDRMEYTKGIIKRLEAFRDFLEKYPEYQEKVTYLMVSVPSRTGVDDYKYLKKKVDELVGSINADFGSIDWVPVRYFFRSFSFSSLAAMYKLADVALVTPLRDGMNLVAKEYVATKKKKDGVLVLSEMAGTAMELGETLVVNPNDHQAMVDVIKQALTLPKREKEKRNQIMRARLERYDIKSWAKDFIASFEQVNKTEKELRERQLSNKEKKKIISHYKRSKKRLFLLDYDGTLTSFSKNIKQVSPDKNLISILKNLSNDKKNNLVLISGRDRKTLDSWFGDLKINLIAEHGLWIKEKNKKWHLIENLQDDWKKSVKEVMEIVVDRTPGSFIEEKEYSLVWHFRKVDPKLAKVRSRELKNRLFPRITHENLDIMDGNKVIEVKNAGINKGRAVQQFLNGHKRDFVLAAGDDVTDEDVFEVLDDKAYSFKMGYGFSKAKYNISSIQKLKDFLRDLYK